MVAVLSQRKEEECTVYRDRVHADISAHVRLGVAGDRHVSAGNRNPAACVAGVHSTKELVSHMSIPILKVV